MAAAKWKALFLTKTQALLHGDLHTGSVMATEGSTFIIDPEFAFYGPMGFDVGAILSNLYLAFFATYSDDKRGVVGGGSGYADWLLAQIVELHAVFEATFLAEWERSSVGELYRKEVYAGEEELKKAKERFLLEVLTDSLGFAGMKMIRRIVGIAHVEDLDSIGDQDLRVLSEKRALRFARRLVISPTDFGGVNAVNLFAKDVYQQAEIPEKWLN